MAPTGAHPEVKRVTVLTLAWNTRTPLSTIFAKGSWAVPSILPRREAAARGHRRASAIFTVGSYPSSCRFPLSMAAAAAEEGGAALPPAAPCPGRDAAAGSAAPPAAAAQGRRGCARPGPALPRPTLPCPSAHITSSASGAPGSTLRPRPAAGSGGE